MKENFKLLAIRPLPGCNKRFLKNLTAGNIYKFYNSALFLNSEKRSVSKKEKVAFIDHNVNIPNELYSVKSSDDEYLDINISAIVGGNGAGKSTLIDLLFAAVYLISVNEEILFPNDHSFKTNKTRIRRLKHRNKLEHFALQFRQEKILHDIFEYETDKLTLRFDELKKSVSDFIEMEKSVHSKREQYERELVDNNTKEVELKKFRNQLKVELYYQIGKVNYQLTINPDLSESDRINLTIIPSSKTIIKNEDIKLTPLLKEEIIEKFFYTIAVNYSHYSLNSKVLGNWITSVFHKNDGYTTPLVINPMRTDGNFNINKEIVFAKYRFLANALTEHFYTRKPVKVTDNQQIHKIRFTLNIEKINSLRQLIKNTTNNLQGNTREANLIFDLFGLYFEGFSIGDALTSDFPLKKELLNYIVEKVDKISELYPGFENGYQFGPDSPVLETQKFLDKLVKDRTHVTYKLHQAMNFVKFMLDNDEQTKLFDLSLHSENLEQIEFEYTLDQLQKYMDLSNASDLNSHLPPSIFNIDFILINNRSKSKSPFERLSSGEQQLIHTIQSVIYHLNNLQSAHHAGSERSKYKFVNIIYDEIELYFHPEYQRRFIKELLAAFKRLHLKSTTRILGINVMFLTHSPFILSDIPSENIMLLKVDKNGKSINDNIIKQSFAANIHDLLADSFFLKGPLMGRFAEDQLNQLIDEIGKNKNLSESDQQLLKMIGDPYLRISLQEFQNAEQ